MNKSKLKAFFFIATAGMIGVLPLLGACAAAVPAAESALPGLSGTYAGDIVVSKTMRIVTVIRIEAGADGSYAATFQSPTQSPELFPVKSISVKGANIEFSVPALKASYRARFDPTTKAFKGSWKQGFGSYPLDAARIKGDFAFSRPQEPKPPFPYAEKELTFRNPAAGIELAGTLSVPAGTPRGGLVLVSGSGAQDRDEALAGHRPFFVLADWLARAGYAVLRYDDRGTAKSGGTFQGATSADFATDAAAALAALRASKAAGPGPVGILGHSEGGLIAAILASGPEPRPDFCVLIGGPAVRGDQILMSQSRAIMKASGQNPLNIETAAKVNRKIYDLLLAKAGDPSLEKELRKTLMAAGVIGKAQDAQVAQLTDPWFLYFVALDPAPLWKASRLPVLALYGSLDLQVPSPWNPEGMRDLLAAAGNPASKVLSLEGLNHMMQKAKTGSPSEYAAIEETMNPAVRDALLPWLGSLPR